MVKTCREGRRLSKVAAQFDNRDAAVDGSDLAKQVERAVARAIVDQNEFEGLALNLHDRLEAIVKICNVLLLVMQGDND